MGKLILAILAGLGLYLAGCKNVLEAPSNKSTNDATYESGKMAVNSGNWDLALTKLTSLSASYFDSEDKKLVMASAYAGKCGLNFSTYAANLASVTIVGTFFSYLMTQWSGVAIYPSYCASAEQWINAISPTPAGRSATANFDMMILGMVKVGVYLRNVADIDGASGLGNGTVDATFNVCTASPSAANVLDDTMAREVASGFANFLVNASASTAMLSVSIQNAVTALNATCTAGFPYGPSTNPCTVTNSAQVTAAGIAAIRDILNNSALGIGSCAVTVPYLGNPGDVSMDSCCP